MMPPRRRNELRWLLVIVLLLVIGSVGLLTIFRVGAPTASAVATVTLLPSLNSTEIAQMDATLTVIAIEPTRVIAAATETPLPPSATASPTETRAATVQSTIIIGTKQPNPISDVAKTATALAIQFESTLITPTSRPIGGGYTNTPQPPEPPTSVALIATSTPLSTPTPTPTGGDLGIVATELPTPLVVAEANLQIRSDISGEVIGDGTLRVYAPQSAHYPETAHVELELHLDNLYITPTPNGSSATAVPRSTSVASSSGATPTPFVPIITDQGVPVYQRMGATLLCSAQSFVGCDKGRDQSQTKIVSSQVTSWSWILAPNQDITGAQDLELDVWLVERNLDGALEYLDLPGTPYHFTIQIEPVGGFNPVPLIAVIAALVIIVGAFILLRRRSVNTTQSVPLARKQPAPSVFISYRRGPSWGQARSIEQSLRERGANVFIDIDDINEGRFAETIEKAIADCDYFVAVLAPGTLDSTWVRREIAYALSCKKIIVPLLMDGFKLDASNVPAEIQDIASHNAITILPEFYQEAIDRLAERFLRLGNKKN